MDTPPPLSLNERMNLLLVSQKTGEGYYITLDESDAIERAILICDWFEINQNRSNGNG